MAEETKPADTGETKPTEKDAAYWEGEAKKAFKARDGYLAFAAGNDRQWETFCNAVGRPEWVDDERFSTNPARNRNRTLLIGLLNELFQEREVAEWIALCDEIGLPAGPINDMQAVFNDPQVRARGLVQEVSHPTAGSVPVLASPLNVPTSPAGVRLPPPLLGQHTEEVLADVLGYDAEAVAALRQEGVV